MKKIHVVGGALLCSIVDVFGAASSKTLGRVPSSFNITDVSANQDSKKSTYRRIDLFCKNNGAISDCRINSEFDVLKKLNSIAKKIGYQDREPPYRSYYCTADDNYYYAVDISFPAIKEYATRVVGVQPQGDELPQITELRDLLNVTRNIKYKTDDRAKTGMTPEQKNLILDKCKDFFDVTSLSTDQQKKINDAIGLALDNFTGFQCIMAALIVGLLNSSDEGFSKGFTKIGVVKIDTGVSCFST
jgi:hypothetical protein